jgi:hypothetical protein
MQLAVCAVLIGSFLLFAPYLNVLGTGARETGYETRAELSTSRPPLPPCGLSRSAQPRNGVAGSMRRLGSAAL